MPQAHQPATVAECIEMLTAVMARLDAIEKADPDRRTRTLAFAAIRIQEAVDLIGADDVLDS